MGFLHVGRDPLIQNFRAEVRNFSVSNESQRVRKISFHFAHNTSFALEDVDIGSLFLVLKFRWQFWRWYQWYCVSCFMRSNLTRIIYQSNQSFNIPPPLGIPPLWRLFLPGREGIWSPLMIASFDVMLQDKSWRRRRGDVKLWWIQRKRLRICGGLVEN